MRALKHEDVSGHIHLEDAGLRVVCTCTFKLSGADESQHQNECAAALAWDAIWARVRRTETKRPTPRPTKRRTGRKTK